MATAFEILPGDRPARRPGGPARSRATSRARRLLRDDPVGGRAGFADAGRALAARRRPRRRAVGDAGPCRGRSRRSSRRWGSGSRVEVAGGLRDEAAVAGVARRPAPTRAVVGTAALADPAFAGAWSRRTAPDRIAVAIDVRDGRAVGHGWVGRRPGVDADDADPTAGRRGRRDLRGHRDRARRPARRPGPGPLRATRRASTVGSIIASGGIATVDDLRAVRDIGCAGAIVGRALYEGRLDLRALAVARSADAG